MIISASRRTDIPAFYAEWFMNRLRAGYCRVPNPIYPNQSSLVSLRPGDVDVIVFWTRQPRPLFPYLEELEASGYRYYFQFSLLAYPRELEPYAPSFEAAVSSFRQLAERLGPERLIWRYDPIILTPATDTDYHRRTFARLADALQGCTRRVVVSLVDMYRKSQKRMQALAEQGFGLLPVDQETVAELLPALVDSAGKNGMTVTSCAEEHELRSYGIMPGKCVDDAYIRQVFGLQVSSVKDPSQRPACGCVVSRDIGMYDSCLFGCRYCYATGSEERARRNHQAHDPAGEVLFGKHADPENGILSKDHPASPKSVDSTPRRC